MEAAAVEPEPEAEADTMMTEAAGMDMQPAVDMSEILAVEEQAVKDDVVDYTTPLSYTKPDEKDADEKKGGEAKGRLGDLVKESVSESMNMFLDVIQESHPVAAAAMIPLKGLINAAIGVGGEHDQIMEKLDKLEEQIKSSEKELKGFVGNAVTFGNYGSKLTSLDSVTELMLTRIKDIKGNSSISEDEKNRRIAALYHSDTFGRYINEASRIFNGDTLNRLEKASIYDLAYEQASKSSMFRGEAIDRTAPYLFRAMTQYVKANAVWGEILNAKEKMEGPESVRESRRQMAENLVGSTGRNGSSKGILGKYREYFSQDRLVFINKGDGTNKEIAGDILILDPSVKASMETMVRQLGGSDIRNLLNMVLLPEQQEMLLKHAVSLNLDGDKNQALIKYLKNLGFHFTTYDGHRRDINPAAGQGVFFQRRDRNPVIGR